MNDVDAYIAGVEPNMRTELERIRALVKKTTPDAVESVSYGMPAYKYKGKPLIYYAAFKNHMSVFPTPDPAAQLHDRLSSYKVSKGTIQFQLTEPIPYDLIEKITKFRVEENIKLSIIKNKKK